MMYSHHIKTSICSIQLRDMAFGNSKSGKKRTTSQSGDVGSQNVPEEQWEQWKQADEEVRKYKFSYTASQKISANYRK